MHADALFKLGARIQVAIFRATNGRAMSRMRGMPVLLLTTTGRKTKMPRTTPLMYIRDGDAFVITASNSGSDKHPGWFLNLQASPDAQIEVPGAKLSVSAAVASVSEQARLWPELVARAPFFEGYQKGTSRFIAMVILKPR